MGALERTNHPHLVKDDMIQQQLTIEPSADAREIDAAHKVLRLAIGTPQEAVARKYLEIVVAKIRARQP